MFFSDFIHKNAVRGEIFMNEKIERILWIDVARGIAILLVA